MCSEIQRMEDDDNTASRTKEESLCDAEVFNRVMEEESEDADDENISTTVAARCPMGQRTPN